MTRPTVVLLGLILTIASNLISPKGANAQNDPPPCSIQKPTILVGEASWYGPGFHGNATAIGETFDQNDPTTAACLDSFTEKRLCLRVTNLENQRSIQVRCIDTGRFCEKYGRVIDLSRQGSINLRGEGDRPGSIPRVKIEPITCRRRA